MQSLWGSRLLSLVLCSYRYDAAPRRHPLLRKNYIEPSNMNVAQGSQRTTKRTIFSVSEICFYCKGRSNPGGHRVTTSLWDKPRLIPLLIMRTQPPDWQVSGPLAQGSMAGPGPWAGFGMIDVWFSNDLLPGPCCDAVSSGPASALCAYSVR